MPLKINEVGTLIADNLTMIIHAIPGKITTLYAAQYPSGRILLLDSGCACDKDAVVQYFESLGICESNVRCVVASHAHPDHAGGAFRWQSSGAFIAAPEGINLWYSGLCGWLQQRVDMGLVLFVEDVASRSPLNKVCLVVWELLFPSASVRFPRSLKYDYTIPVPRPDASNDALNVLQPIVGPNSNMEAEFPELSEWRCLPAPGHTDHMVALWHAPSCTLYAADALLHLPHQPRALQPPVTIDFKDLYISTVQRLAQFPVRNLLLAHGGSFMVKPAVIDSEHNGSVEIRSGIKDSTGLVRPFAGGVWNTAIDALGKRLHKNNGGLKGWRATMLGILNLPNLLSPRLIRLRRALKGTGT